MRPPGQIISRDQVILGHGQTRKNDPDAHSPSFNLERLAPYQIADAGANESINLHTWVGEGEGERLGEVFWGCGELVLREICAPALGWFLCPAEVKRIFQWENFFTYCEKSGVGRREWGSEYCVRRARKNGLGSIVVRCSCTYYTSACRKLPKASHSYKTPIK